ncbi:Zn(2)-C6 fungal-type DNA-binding domain [Fusarium oxysporum f. sp. vasinfectum]|nr:Zn(2)-C6 fungal-type DNA-binding domain [Fusarium oxysporum f. sp. vasinfectum]
MSNRQRNTTSCNECKRRKLRCDAQQPQCGFCLRSNTLCEASPRGKRGPKRGHLNALRNRLGQLEEMLQSRFELEQTQELQTHQQTGLHYLPTFESQLPDTASLNLGVPLDSPLPQAKGLIDPVVHAELDQLYFDRVHPSFPILHQASYLAWSRSASKSIVQTCLQRIMWIIAILLSTQFRELIEPLYTQVKKDLESSESFEVEHAQSWALLTVCELMRASYSQSWISSGRMFRLVQGLRYHEIDSPDKVHSSKEDSTRTEEKRRVFWMAYLLDHLFGMRNDWPVTLSEHMVSYLGHALTEEAYD